VNQSIPNRKTFILIIAISIVGSMLWLITLFALWSFLRFLKIQTDFFTLVESLSTAVAAAAVITAGFVAYKELSEVSNSRHIEIVNQLFEDLNSNENIEARRWVFQNLNGDPEKEFASISPEGRTAIKRVLNSLDHVSFLTQPGFVDESIVMPWMNLMIVKSWKKLGPYVEYERQRRKEPDYYRTAQQLGTRCITWREKNIRDAEFIWVEDAL
jgi:hypothetical protein